MKNPRRTIGRKVVYKNEWYSIWKDEVIRPDGSKGDYYVLDRKPTVVIIPIEKNKIWLVEQFRYPVKRRGWEVPMGTTESDSSGLKHAKKELKEESGIIAKNWKKLGHFAWANGMSNQLAYVYLATDLRFGKTEREPEEMDMRMKAFSLTQIDKMIKNSQITDSGTIVALYQLKLYNKHL